MADRSRAHADASRGRSVDSQLPTDFAEGTSWFGSLDATSAPGRLTSDMAMGPAAAMPPPPAVPLPEEAADTGALADTLSARGADARSADEGSTQRARPAFQRIYRAFLAARAALGLLLVASQAALLLIGNAAALPGMVIGIGYATIVIVQWLMPRRAGAASGDGVLTRRRWVVTIGLDLATFTVLNVVGAATSAHAAFFVLPVLMAGVLASRVGALAVAAAASIVLLAVASTQAAAGSESWLLITQAGIAGGGLFLVALVARELASRLAREERAARDTLEVARQQAQLNRLVIDEMQEGVMVVDRHGRVRVANPVSRALLKASAPPGASFPLRGVEAWEPLVGAVERAFAQGGWPAAGRDVALALNDGERTAKIVLRVRMRFTQRRQASAREDLCVLFLEDVRAVQARSRQEKLAAMGRVSAGIAHEIRNPLAAIAQANALLGEDVHDPAQRRLIQMVADNAERLRRIVDDVLEVAPGDRELAGVIDLTTLVGSVLGEWARTAGVALGDHGPLDYDLGDQAIGVRFDPDHLRRVLVNLLDNGLRHSSAQTRAVHVTIEQQGTLGVRLAVASDGAPIAADVEPYLFEPFYSTRSRGTGLGLYICRELCERYGATIDYRQQDASHRHRNVFTVVMQRHELQHGEPRLSLSA